MRRRRRLQPLPVWEEVAVLAAFDEADVKHVHATALYAWLARHPEACAWEDVRWAELDGFPARARAALERDFALYTSRVETEDAAADGSTTKLAIRLQDGHAIEAVLIHHEGRRTLCLSSQVGCAMGCSFCATGTMGILGDLVAGEMIEQLQHARARAPTRNVVWMGMGEPLNNYDAVLRATRSMIDVTRFSLSPAHVTISTVGIVPRMTQLAADEPRVNLALSLHAPTQAQREAIMPAARAYPLSALLGALDEYVREARARTRPEKSVMIEYIMLAGVNDSLDDARALGHLLGSRPVVVNLIPYNPTDATAGYCRSADADTDAFLSALVTEFGLKTFVRRTMGSDVASACGQLVREKQRPRALGDIEDAGSRARGRPGARPQARRPQPQGPATEPPRTRGAASPSSRPDAPAGTREAQRSVARGGIDRVPLWMITPARLGVLLAAVVAAVASLWQGGLTALPLTLSGTDSRAGGHIGL